MTSAKEFFIDLLKVLIPLTFFTWLLGWGIYSLAQNGIAQREEQRAACVRAGGKYAESARLAPDKDFCIR
jgi:hypothetical protein